LLSQFPLSFFTASVQRDMVWLCCWIETPVLTEEEAARRDAFVERLSRAFLKGGNLVTAYLGDCLGLYRALADLGPATSTELSARAGPHERYTREWLEQSAPAPIHSRIRPHHAQGAEPALYRRIANYDGTRKWLKNFPMRSKALLVAYSQLRFREFSMSSHACCIYCKYVSGTFVGGGEMS